jgi:uncharacterized protein YndB with AHSA1/START domain/DNA-binding transcriptional ArsR family regulator
MTTDDDLNRAFAALADPTRRAILQRLAQGEAGVVELAQGSPLTQPAITKHLKVLERAGLIGRARDGQRRPARLRLDGLLPVDDWLRTAHLEWTDRFDRLEAHLKKTRRLDMPETRTALDVRAATPVKQLVIERTFKAAPERIFDAFTDAKQLTKWWWPKGFSCPSAEVDLRVGGSYRVAMEWPDFIPVDQQFSHYLGGEYFEIDRPHRLVMSGRAINEDEGEIFATLIELTLEERDGGTALTMRQSYFEPMPPPEAMGGAEQGWNEQLDKLEELLAS